MGSVSGASPLSHSPKKLFEGLLLPESGKCNRPSLRTAIIMAFSTCLL
jgi:hypothetical protein